MPLTEADSDKAYASACDAIQNRIRDRVGRKCFVFFSAYKLDADQLPIDNLDEVPVAGKLLIKGGRDRTCNAQMKKEYESPIMDNPSWLDLCVIANDQISATRDRDHRYLEHIEVVEKVGDIQVAVFCLVHDQPE